MSGNAKVSRNHYKDASKIIGIQFSMLSPEEIRKTSVVEVVNRDTYINNKPVIGGLFDPRMGVLEPGSVCPTDGLSYIDTPGYFGHIELARPVLFIQHVKEIIKISRCICFKCSKLLVNKEQHKHISKFEPESRWSYITNISSKIKRCGEQTEHGCGCKQPDKIKLDGMASIYAIWDNIEVSDSNENQKIVIKLTPELILKMFKRITDDDINFMGFSSTWSRPEWMICQVLPVPPPAVRPSVKHDGQQRSDDDLTHIYMNIIKYNNILTEKVSNPETSSKIIEDWTDILQHSIAMVVNNKIKGVAPMAQRSGRPLQCIMGRINHKNGIIRGNLMGKRVDYSARSVITGDPGLSIKQLGVPIKIAMNLTKPVTVNDMNRDFLAMLIKNGPDTFPGAKILERRNGVNITLRHVDRTTINLENGDVVHRHMMDGDAVLFNRQPSLHRCSMMCHIAKIMKKGDTFRFNVAVTKPYNADFDGDEMNMHLPQNVLAETELRHLSATPSQIILPTNNSPVIGIYQDSLLGSYRFTRKNVYFTPRTAMNLLMSYPKVNTDNLRKSIVGGVISNFDILSQIIPPMTLLRKTGFFEDGEDYNTSNNVLEINNGVYKRGQLEKKELGSSTKGILHRIFNDFGSMECADFIDNLQNIVNEYMKTSSYSVGISDLISDSNTQLEITKIITEQKEQVQKIMEQVHLGVFENETAATNLSEFETRVNNTLNDATNKTGKVGRKSLDKNNRFLMIVESGSKGSLLNISQMISCLGQQNIDGKRIPYGFESRTLPHYNKFDDSPEARGFIENSYISGLTVGELFFHAMAGRTGLIDTAIKTSQTGYIQRRLIKALEDVTIAYDMTARNNMGKIIQFKYGDDGFESTKVENQFIPLVGMSIEDIYLHYDIIGINGEPTSSLNNIYTKTTITRLNRQREKTVKKCKEYIDTMILNRDQLVTRVFKNRNDNMVRVPVAFQYIITNIQGQLNLTNASSTDITPMEAFELIEEYYTKLETIGFMTSNSLFKILYFFYLTPKDLITKRRFHKKGLIFLLETIVFKYKEAIVHPGECVGVVAGQSIGEPSTQLTLNTFHNSGVSSKSNVTRGVPRIEEILRITKNPKNPSLTIFLKHQDETDKDKAINYSNIIGHTRLVDVVKSIQICFDPNEQSTFFKEDTELIEQYNEFEKLINECNQPDSGFVSGSDRAGATPASASKSKWIIRMEIDKSILLDKNITMDDIQFAISQSSYGQDINCVFSDYNMDNLIFRLRLNSNVFNKTKKRGVAESLDQTDEIYLLKNFQDTLLNNIVLRGVSGISNVSARKIQNAVSKKDGKYVTEDIWILDTVGSNLMDILAMDYIDYKRTVSNDIREVFNVLGIEAARQVIFDEFSEVMEFSDVYINYHHLSLLCDRMTCNQNLVSIFRSGLINDNTGPLAKASFETHCEVLLNSARHGLIDTMRGASASIFVGATGYYGTSSFSVILDTEKMQSLDAERVVNTNTDDDVERVFDRAAELNDSCSKNNLTINTNISNILVGSSGGVCDDNYELDF